MFHCPVLYPRVCTHPPVPHQPVPLWVSAPRQKKALCGCPNLQGLRRTGHGIFHHAQAFAPPHQHTYQTTRCRSAVTRRTRPRFSEASSAGASLQRGKFAAGCIGEHLHQRNALVSDILHGCAEGYFVSEPAAASIALKADAFKAAYLRL